jgi:hypothetical protein
MADFLPALHRLTGPDWLELFLVSLLIAGVAVLGLGLLARVAERWGF